MFNVEIGRTRDGTKYFVEIRTTVRSELEPYRSARVLRKRLEHVSLLILMGWVVDEAIDRIDK